MSEHKKPDFVTALKMREYKLPPPHSALWREVRKIELRQRMMWQSIYLKEAFRAQQRISATPQLELAS